MDIEKIRVIIKQLKQLEKEDFSPQNDELFTDAKNKLMQNAPAGLKSRMVDLDYCYYPDVFDDPVPNVSDVKKLIQLYEEELFNLQEPFSKEDLYKKKLLQAKNMSPNFISKLGEMVVGDYHYFPRRTSWYITKFFEESGFPQLKHNGNTRRIWAAKQLEDMSLNDLYKIIQCLFKRKYFEGDECDIKEAKEALRQEINNACQEDDIEDLSDVFDIDINTSLLFNKEIRTDDDILNSDIEKAKEQYIKGDLQLAVEKIWDSFERIKSYYDKDKKSSVKKIVASLSDEIKSAKSSQDTDEDKFFEKELRELTELGNNYKIRHSEKDRAVITNHFTQEYLFFRVLNLIILIHARMD